MKILVTGSDGQLGQCLQKILTSEDELKTVLPNKEDFALSYFFTTRDNFDIAGNDVEEVLSDIMPDVVINCAAYTDTYGAEENPEKAFMVNTYGVSNIAMACNKLGIKLIHISTDFVFDGEKSSPYTVEDKCHPINMYGVTKYFGEKYVQSLCPNAIIVRTSWLYSEFGNNFVKKIIDRLNKKDYMAYVYDEVSTPTYAMNLAKFLILLAIRDFMVVDPLYHIKGIYHFTDNGVASRYDFAKAIEEIYFGEDRGLVCACLSGNNDSSIKRPKYSVLDNTRGVRMMIEYKSESWRTALKKCIDRIKMEEPHEGSGEMIFYDKGEICE